MSQFAPPGDSYDREPRDAWLPKLRTGPFYVNDRAYYLYAKKRTVSLRDATHLVFELADLPVSGSVQLLLEGIPFKSFQVEANTITVRLADIQSFAGLWSDLQLDKDEWDYVVHDFQFGPTNEIRVTYDLLEWQDTAFAAEPSGNKYVTRTAAEVFQLKDAHRIDYRLMHPTELVAPSGIGDLDPITTPTGWRPDPPQGQAPVVITDDTIEYGNGIDFQTEFAVDPITGEIIFNVNRNLLQNPDFSLVSTGVVFADPSYPHPDSWRDTEPAQTPLTTGTPYHGKHAYVIQNTGILEQTVRINPRQHYTTSIYCIDGTGELGVSFLDKDKFYITGTETITTTGQPLDAHMSHSVEVGKPTWSRVSLTFGEASEAWDAPPSILPIPTAAEYLEFKLRKAANSLGDPIFDAAMVEVGLTATQFQPLDPSGITVEYETDPTGFYTPSASDLFIPELSDPDANPLSTPMPGGFLFIEEFSSVDDYQLGVGSITPDVSGMVSPTGVLDTTGIIGIDVGRRHVPYAKTSGFPKFIQRPTFHTQNPTALYDVTDLLVPNGNPAPLPTGIEWVVAEGLEAPSETDVRLVVVPDARLTYRLDAYVTDAQQNPAFMYRGTASAPTGVVYPDDPVTSHAGQIPLLYTPPTIPGTGYLGKIDAVTLFVAGVQATIDIHGYRDPGLDFDAFLGV